MTVHTLVDSLIFGTPAHVVVTYGGTRRQVLAVVLSMEAESGNKDRHGRFYNWNVKLQVVHDNCNVPSGTYYIRCEHTPASK